MGSLNDVGGHCPACGAEDRPGFDTRADDGTPLVPGPIPERVASPYGRGGPTFLGGPVSVPVPREGLARAAEIVREIEGG